MRVDANDMDYIGCSTWTRLCKASVKLLNGGKFGGRAWVDPWAFQSVQNELVANRDPTLRAEWDGNRCYLRASVCGRELVIHMRENLADHEFEMSEEAEPVLPALSDGRTHGDFLMNLAKTFDGMARGLRVVALAFLQERYDARGERRT